MFTLVSVKRSSLAGLSGFVFPAAVVLIAYVALSGSPFRGPVLMLLVWLAMCHMTMRWFSRMTAGDDLSGDDASRTMRRRPRAAVTGPTRTPNVARRNPRKAIGGEC
jgi:hypothetical protein